MDVWKWAINSADKELYKDEDEKPKHEHGIPIDHYYVCKKDAGDYVIEIEICVTQKDVQLPFPGINGSLPVRIDIKRYYSKYLLVPCLALHGTVVFVSRRHEHWKRFDG